LRDKGRRRRVASAVNELIFDKLVGEGKVSAGIAGLAMLHEIRARDSGVPFSEIVARHFDMGLTYPEEFYAIPRAYVDDIASAWDRYRTFEAQTLDEAFRFGGPGSNRSPRRVIDDLTLQYFLATMVFDHLAYNSARGRPIATEAAIEWAEDQLANEAVESSKKAITAAWRTFGPFLEAFMKHQERGGRG
tara:strand:- start:636 stop:1205 length:570 start_codon:yes stop_codon:yes gene_type:complete